MRTASAATVAAAASSSFAVNPPLQRVFITSNTPNGILAYTWDPNTAELAPDGVAAKLDNVDWIAFSPDRNYIYAAAEVDSFNGKATGEVASFQVRNGSLIQISAENSASKGTCHVAVDHTGRVLVSADYGGGSAASYKLTNGRISPLVWEQHYVGHGPVKDRQATAHAHFASFSPDNRFAYVNDLGSDCIHIYHVNIETAVLTAAGTWHAKPGSGPRTLHFHPNGKTAYCVTELTSTVVVLHWNQADGSLTPVTTINLLPPGYQGATRGCDTVIPRDGKFVYFANRDDNFLYSFKADPTTGALTPMVRSSCGGKTPRSFTLDPTERWLLVANQDSNVVSVFSRNINTGALSKVGKNYAAEKPMCILFA